MEKIFIIVIAIVGALAGCASAPARQGDAGDTVLQFVDIRNDSGEPVTVTARVGASAEQNLGFLGPAESRRFDISTGASSTGTLVLRARNAQTGREATQTLEISPGQTLQWVIRFF